MCKGNIRRGNSLKKTRNFMNTLYHHPELKQLTFFDRRYYLRSEDVYYPSVSTILAAYPKGEFFFKWLKENGDDANNILEEAGEDGTAVHEGSELIDKGFEITWADSKGNPQYKKHVWEMLLKYQDFRNTVDAEIIAMETQIFSDKYGYAGTQDRLFTFKFDGLNYVIDIKTSNSIYPTMHMQTAAYAKAIEETYGIKVDKTGILWLKAKTRTYGKNNALQGPGWQIISSPSGSIDKDFESFLSVYNVWKLANPDARPYNVILPDRIQLPKEKIKIQNVL